MKHFLASLPVLTLSMCATIPEPVVTRDQLECAPAPRSPVNNPAAGIVEGGDYVIDLALAGEDCRSRLGSVRRILYPETE